MEVKTVTSLSCAQKPNFQMITSLKVWNNLNLLGDGSFIRLHNIDIVV
jgi:hypothetical protein